MKIELIEIDLRVFAHALAVYSRQDAKQTPNRQAAERNIFRNRQGRHHPQLLRNSDHTGENSVARIGEAARLARDFDRAAVGAIDSS